VALRGLGQGLRIGDYYLLLAPHDRPPQEQAERDVAADLQAAVAWFAASGIGVAAEDLPLLRRLALVERLPLDHVAFASSDFARVVARLAQGTKPVAQSADAALFVLAGGARVEVVPAADVPEPYWCPMHPDVRSNASGSCPLCGMVLTLIPPPRLREYHLRAQVLPGGSGGGFGRLRLSIERPEDGAPVRDLVVVHERPLHIFVIGRDLEHFAHVHPDSVAPGLFQLDHEAAPGEYVVIADFLPSDGTAQLVHRAVVTPGFAGRLRLVPPPLAVDVPDMHGIGRQAPPGSPRWGSAAKVVDGTRVRLDVGSLIAGRPGILRFTLSDAASGAPVIDLESFLGAPGHVLITRTDLTEAVHGHPQPQTSNLAVVSFAPQLPSAGVYKLWAQFQRNGRVITVPFVVEVAES
jgi:hypothetical protein